MKEPPKLAIYPGLIIKERHKTHGDYQLTAGISQQLKKIINAQTSWDKLNNMQRESLDMIATKLGRILAGDADFADHWLDISGYAMLMVEQCRK